MCAQKIKCIDLKSLGKDSEDTLILDNLWAWLDNL